MAEGKYETHVKPKLFLVECWARDGLVDVQIAEKLGISEASFYKYRNEHREFMEALKDGKEVVDFEVECALLKRARGYKFEEVTKEILPILNEYGQYTYDEHGNIKKALQVVKSVLKEVQPDTTAQIFWLKNRKPKLWRDRRQLDLGTAPGEDMTEEEIDKMLEKLEKKE